MRFAESDLAAMAAAKEVDIETRSPAGEAHRTIIWIVEREGTVYVRSYRGPRGRWFREAVADPEVAIHVDGRRRLRSACAVEFHETRLFAERFAEIVDHVDVG